MKQLKKHHLIPIIIIITSALTVAAMFGYENFRFRSITEHYKAGLVKDFLDPESTKFRDTKLVSLQPTFLERVIYGESTASPSLRKNPITGYLLYDPNSMVLCGEANTKNSSGAYTGYKAFHVLGGEGEAIAFVDERKGDKTARELCEIGNNVIYSPS